MTPLNQIDVSIRARVSIERKIAKRCIKELLKADYLLGVNDGEETVIKHSSDEKAVFEAMFSTDEDYLYVYDKETKKRIGWIYFVYGNDGYDVISDYTVNLDPVLHGVGKYAESLN